MQSSSVTITDAVGAV